MQKLCEYESLDISPSDVEEVTVAISELIIDIAFANTDFVCGDCLRVKDRLLEILAILDGEMFEDTLRESDGILSGGEV